MIVPLAGWAACHLLTVLHLCCWPLTSAHVATRCQIQQRDTDTFPSVFREMFIGHLSFCVLTAVVFGYILVVLSADARHKEVPFPFGPLRRIIAGGGGT